ncbi:MAG: hypothetical protein JXR68_12095 [Bacteroidales bacterium]|nr:hypothetical protein [Bacteroidales bacterium]
MNNILLLSTLGIAAAAFFAGKKTEKETQNSTVKDAEKEVEKDKLSYSNSWYSQAADALQMQLQKTWSSRILFFDTAGKEAVNESLKVILSLKTKSDYLKLLATFGKRSAVSASITINEPLNKWLIHFLEDKDYENGNTKINALKFVRNYLQKFEISI